jgi:heme O synthase-like polyprenyltransferase
MISVKDALIFTFVFGMFTGILSLMGLLFLLNDSPMWLVLLAIFGIVLSLFGVVSTHKSID